MSLQNFQENIVFVLEKRIILEGLHHSNNGRFIENLFPSVKDHITGICTVTDTKSHQHDERRAIITFSLQKCMSSMIKIHNL